MRMLAPYLFGTLFALAVAEYAVQYINAMFESVRL